MQLAVSLDGYIEGPRGEYDWCFTDQDYGMTDFIEKTDAVIMGRKSYELLLQNDNDPYLSRLKLYVVSNTLGHIENGIVIKGDIYKEVSRMKNDAGKDIWLYGGAELVTSMMNLNLVDELMLAVHPVILGTGKPLFRNIAESKFLKLKEVIPYSSGLVMLRYTVPG